ncbi:MAG TPA: MarP family serine protease [Solirubrobacteraceae bacterium]|nr:MarP family serine protease [Solirubrobacteraceae bacterium]
MTSLDWIAAGVIAVVALMGLRRGLVGGVLGLAGIAAGAYLGAKLAPEFLSGRESPYTPLVALGGALVLVILLQSVASTAGSAIRTSLFAVPPLRLLDSLGGLLLGAAMGAALVWVAGAVALHLPGQTQLREEVQRSRILGEINQRVPPSRLLDAIERVDPFLVINGPEANVAPPDPALLASPAVRAARDSVFRVTGTACGLGVAGSGWAAAPNLVVTNAHVVAGMKDPRVDRRDGDYRDAVVVAFDVHDDIAVLRVGGLGAKPLEAAAPEEGRSVAILGYPNSGPFTATPGRIGQTADVLTEDAYGKGPVRRLITTLRGAVRHGNSGGPAIDARGRVQTTIFAARTGADDQGFGVPTQLVEQRLAAAGSRSVSTGACVG